MTDTTDTPILWQTKQRKEEMLVKDHTKLGIYLLIPPFVLWAAVIIFMIDQTLGEYVFSMFTPNSLDVTFFITGMIFPGAAVAASAWGLSKKEDTGPNLGVLLVSIMFLTLVAIQLF